MILTIIHIIVSFLLAVSILLQTRASGLSSAISGQMGATNVVKRRGAELFVYKATIWLTAIFLLLPILRWYVTF